MISFWEREHLVQYDFIVIGSGITGLSTAIHLGRSFPDSSISILEEGLLPSGASTKNAGFACFGSPTEILSELLRQSENEVLSLVERRWKGLSKLRKLTGDKEIDYKAYGGYEIFQQNQSFDFQHLDYLNGLLYPIFKKAVYSDESNLVDTFGFDSGKVKAIVRNSLEGQLNTGKLVKKLLQIAKSHKVDIYSGCLVKNFEDTGNHVELNCESSGKNYVFRTGKLAICTNGFTNRLIPDSGIVPGRGTVLVTKPIKNIKIKGSFHYDEGFFYFRNIENRILFGGGRNIDFETEETTSFDTNEKIVEKLKSDLNEFILPDHDYKIDMIWSGIMGFSANRQPVIKRHSDNVSVGAALGGMGVAIGTLAGEELAELVSR